MLRRAAPLFAVVALASACGTADTVTVRPFLEGCEGVGPSSCMVVDEGEGDGLFYQGIEGFTFRWCVESELKVVVEPVIAPEPDASSLRYVMRDVVAERPSGVGTLITSTFDAAMLAEQGLAAAQLERCEGDDCSFVDEAIAAEGASVALDVECREDGPVVVAARSVE